MINLLMILLGFSPQARATDTMSVVDVRRNITLAEDDPVYKDFYISAGPGSGLKKNLVVTAVRKLNIRDASGANAVGEIKVPVGQLKIIAVYDRVAVAREYALLSREDLPMLEQVGIMNGDSIDLQGSFVDSSKPKNKKKTAEVATTPLVTVAVAAPNPVDSANTKANDTLAPGQTKASPGETLEKTADSGNNSGHE